MTEEGPKANAPSGTAQEGDKELKKEAHSLWENIKSFLSELLDIRSDTDRDSTIEAVKKDIPFKGHNAWILIFSIFVASIGLNVSSTAVVIGAMLISPLMGPIVGMGLSVAINDLDTLKRSLINLGIMVVLSVLTAFIYFSLSPLTKLTPELEARTYPTILDVLVAIFGGLALIVAKTKKGTIASVIFGVAIATALMPPLCTVGYGLAVGEWSNASGAFYLFCINAVFIALSTFVVSKLLNFPLVKYANSKKRKFIAQLASIIAIVVMVPSVILFWKLLKKEVFMKNATEYVAQVVQYEGAAVVKADQDYDTNRIDVYLIGNLVPQNVIQDWKEILMENDRLKETNLRIHQGTDQSSAISEQLTSDLKSGILEDLYANNQQALEDKNSQIELLEEQINRMRTSAIPFESLSREVQANYEDLERFGYASTVNTDFSKADTIPTFLVKWSASASAKARKEQEQRLAKWLKVKYQLDTLVISRY
ncbi:MAG: hypothetical protein CL868_04625 [Cytophagaceae bacterium]|nr:hypothetical protein [Cytophagaceae bacterium]